jgi:Transcription factor WhiB/Aldehyde dehydrogenase family
VTAKGTPPRADSDSSARSLATVNPYTGETVREFPFLETEQIPSVVERADKALHAWRQRPVAERAQVVRRRIADALRSGPPSAQPADPAVWTAVTRKARCADSALHPDQWFPVSPRPEIARREAAAAIAICSACPVRAQCLEFSLRHWNVGQHGVWGGLVAADRAPLRRPGRTRQARSPASYVTSPPLRTASASVSSTTVQLTVLTEDPGSGG